MYRLVGIVITVVALGCTFGILGVKNLSSDFHKETTLRVAGLAAQTAALKHEAAVREQTLCWNSFDSRAVIRAVAAGTLQAPLNQKEKAFIKHSPLIRTLIAVANSNSNATHKFVFKLIPLPKNCPGHNPNPVSKTVLIAAGVNSKIQQ